MPASVVKLGELVHEKELLHKIHEKLRKIELG